MTRQAPRPPLSRGPDTHVLLAELAGGIGRIAQGELALAHAEAKLALGSLRRGLVGFAIGAMLALITLGLLAAAAVAALLALGLAPVWACLTVAAITALLALALLRLGAARLAAANVLPRRVLDRLRRDAETLKPMVTKDGC